MKDEIVRLRSLGYTRDQMAEELGVSLSTLKRAISKHGLAKPMVRSTKPKTRKEPEAEQSEPPIEWEFTIVEQAINLLGSRAGEDYRGYLLDGQPVNSDRLIRAAGLRYPGDAS